MKSLLFVLALILSSATLLAQTTPPPASVAMVQDPMSIAASHDFGPIRQGRPVNYVFAFTNTGKEALTIENVAASCGCTTPQWSKESVGPGATGNITVGYNAASEGKFEKSVTIFYNSGKTKTVVIKGEVTKPLPSAPVNESVQLLKKINQ